MDISISRDHVRKPRVRQLQLGCVDRRRNGSLPLRLASVKPAGDPLQRVARGDLSLPPFVDEPSGAHRERGA
jgi:hypothetical protein